MANLGDFVSIPAQSSQTIVPFPISSPAPYAAPVVSGGLGGEGGLLSALVLASVLGNGGLGRGGKDCDGDGNAATIAALSALVSNRNTGDNECSDAIALASILSKLGSIEASVPLAEAQVQLALAGSVANLTAQNTGNTQLLNNGINSVLLNNAGNTAALQSSICAVDTNVDRTGTMLLSAINADGDRTRTLITANQIAELNRIAAERQDEIIELRYNSRADRDRHGIEINMINNQNQNQLQFQQQAQVLGALHHGILEASQSIRATNQAINIGAGTQVASPTNTNSNVRA